VTNSDWTTTVVYACSTCRAWWTVTLFVDPPKRLLCPCRAAIRKT
jgi:hypothetical protein